MEETGVRLRYGDFGGIWVLICTEKMAELRICSARYVRKLKALFSEGSSRIAASCASSTASSRPSL